MRTNDAEPWLAGVDGCPAGWIAAFVRPDGGEARLRIVPRFADVLAAPEAPAVIAVDMPIGLPERTGPGGRAAENAVRPLLGARQSSVFSVPSRAAIYAGDYAEACARALETSDPPRKVSKQLFNIAPRIREIDGLLRAYPAAAARVFEVHPEVAFWRFNGGRALAEPKKVKSRPYEPGLALRRGLLIAAGLPAEAVNATPPKGAGPDDLLDALACAAIARRLHRGKAKPFPDPPPHDAYGWRWRSGRDRRSEGSRHAASQPSPRRLSRLPRRPPALEQSRYRELAENGQSPEIMVIGCGDSRVSPEVIFNARPGELFVVRNVANLVPPYAPDGQAHGVSAALEFGVAALKVQHIVVLGHAQCGGVKAYAEDAEPLSPGDFIGKWMSLMAPAPMDKSGRAARSRETDYLTRLEQANVVNSLDNLLTFPRAAQTGRARPACAPRRLFRRRDRAPVGARSGDRRVQADRGRRSRARLIAKPARLRRLLFACDQLAIDQALGDLHRVERRALAQVVGHDHTSRPFSTVASSRMRLM